MREVHCNLQIIRAYEVPDNLKVDFGLPFLINLSDKIRSSPNRRKLKLIPDFSDCLFLNKWIRKECSLRRMSMRRIL